MAANCGAGSKSIYYTKDFNNGNQWKPNSSPLSLVSDSFKYKLKLRTELSMELPRFILLASTLAPTVCAIQAVWTILHASRGGIEMCRIYHHVIHWQFYNDTFVDRLNHCKPHAFCILPASRKLGVEHTLRGEVLKFARTYRPQTDLVKFTQWQKT